MTLLARGITDTVDNLLTTIGLRRWIFTADPSNQDKDLPTLPQTDAGGVHARMVDPKLMEVEDDKGSAQDIKDHDQSMAQDDAQKVQDLKSNRLHSRDIPSQSLLDTSDDDADMMDGDMAAAPSLEERQEHEGAEDAVEKDGPATDEDEFEDDEAEALSQMNDREASQKIITEELLKRATPVSQGDDQLMRIDALLD